MGYVLFASYYLWPAAGIAILLSFAYFVVSTGQLSRRLLASSHGILLVLAAGYALAISPWSQGPWLGFITPFWAFLVLSLASVVYSLFIYRGKRMLVHGLLLLLIPIATWIWLIGTMTITHDWL